MLESPTLRGWDPVRPIEEIYQVSHAADQFCRDNEGVIDRNLLVDKVQAMFPVDEQAAVMALLDEQDGVRVQLALVKLSDGDVDRLLAWRDEARKDWRDVLAAAEYPRQSGYPGPAPPEVIAADRADYLEWLEGESPT